MPEVLLNFSKPYPNFLLHELCIWFQQAFTTAIKKQGVKVEPQIFSAGNDARFLRQIGIPALGFSPMNHTQVKQIYKNKVSQGQVCGQDCSPQHNIFEKVGRKMHIFPKFPRYFFYPPSSGIFFMCQEC